MFLVAGKEKVFYPQSTVTENMPLDCMTSNCIPYTNTNYKLLSAPK